MSGHLPRPSVLAALTLPPPDHPLLFLPSLAQRRAVSACVSPEIYFAGSRRKDGDGAALDRAIEQVEAKMSGVSF